MICCKLLSFFNYGDKYKLTEQDKFLLEERLLNNEEEPTLYRVHAAYILANFPYVKHARTAFSTISAFWTFATGPLSRNDATQYRVKFLVREILDGLRGLAEFAIKLQHEAYVTEYTGSQRELGVEWFKRSILSMQGPNGLKPKAVYHHPPHAITSAVIEQVKGLPEKDITLLILPEGEPETKSQYLQSL
jgi:hypothetical protein